MKSTIHGTKTGMLEVFVEKDPMILMVRSKDGEVIKHGTIVYIVDEDREKRIYYVAEEIRF
jgi:hypothetical protein